ncbi:MAG: branched-chain amino acid ABC transporter substrate-binding protein, partial [Alcaligenaceae bacterium]
MRLPTRTLAALSLCATLAAGAHAQQGETVRIAFIDPLSGAFANVGQNQLKGWQYVAERLSGANNAAGVKFEVTGFDNKGTP